MVGIIVKSDERRAQEANILRQFGGGSPENSDRLNREYAEEINARMNEVKREVGITRRKLSKQTKARRFTMKNREPGSISTIRSC